MRPIHAVLLAVVLALGLLGLALFLGLDSSGDDPASAGQHDPSGASAPGTDAALVASGDDAASGADPETTRHSALDGRGARGTAKELGLSGRVLDARGRPVAAALVYADGGGPEEFPLDLAGEEGFAWLQRVETKTDADGRFRVRPRAKNQARIAVRAANFAPYDQNFAIAGASHDLGDVVLEDGVVLAGRVVDSSGRPVAGAELFRVRDQTGGLVFLGARGAGALVATTDAHGRFRVDQLRAGPWSLRIETETFPDQLEHGETDRPGASALNLEFVLADGDEISGRIVDAPADALAKLWVRAFPRSANEDSGADVVATGEFFGSPRSARVAADGRFTLRGLKKGRGYRLVARDSEREYGGRTRSSAVQATAGDRDVVLAYKPETAIVCEVVDAVSGAPVEALEVSGGYGFLMPLEDLAGRPQRQFPGGRVRFAALSGRARAGEGAQFSVRAKGFHEFRRDDLALVEGQDLDLGVIRLERSPLVRVTVRDAHSRAPVAGAQVSLNEVEAQAEGGRVFRTLTFDIEGDGDEHDLDFGGGAQARTDKAGVAQLNSKPGQSVVVRVRHTGHAPWESGAIALPADADHELNVELGLGGTVIATVVDARDQPVSGIDVEHEGPGESLQVLRLSGGGDDQSDARGIVEFEHLMPGVHRFRVGQTGNGTTIFGNGAMMRMRGGLAGGEENARGWSEVTVTEGAHETVKLVAPERARLVGRVRETGRTLAGARVELEKQSADEEPRLAFLGGGQSDQTDGQGEYVHDRIDAGHYRVTVTHPSRLMPWEGEVEVNPGENRFDIELPLAILEGRVTGEGGKPLAGVRVRAERVRDDADGSPRVRQRFMAVMRTEGDGEPDVAFGGAGSGQSVTTDSDGKYKLRGVLPDVDLVVKAEAKDAQPGQSEKVRVASDQTKSNVDLQLERGGACEVSLVRRDGKPGGSCMVLATFEGDGGVEPRNEFSGARANVKLGGLKPGRWRLHVDPLGAFATGDERPAIPEQTVDVKAGETATARFELP
jgi:hypothetical protein